MGIFTGVSTWCQHTHTHSTTSDVKALLSEEVYNFVAANAEELDKAMDYKRNLSLKKHIPQRNDAIPKKGDWIKNKKADSW